MQGARADVTVVDGTEPSQSNAHYVGNRAPLEPSHSAGSMTRAAVPQSWKLLYQDGDAWKPVPDTGSEAVAKDAWNTLAFTPVTTSALRIEVELQPDSSGGILEWKVK